MRRQKSIYMPSRRSVKRRLSKRKNTVKTAIYALRVAFMIVICGLFIFMRKNSVNEEYYFSDSRYDGIKSKFLIRNFKKERTSIEYPITKNDFINKTISDKIDEFDSEFRRSVEKSAFDGQLTQDINYQITYRDSDFISIILSVKQDAQGANLVAQQFFWTFSKKDNRIVEIRDLSGGSSEKLDGIITKAKQSLEKNLKAKNISTDLEEVSADDFKNFVILDKNTISWQFGRGQILPSSFGEVSFSLETKDIVEYIDSELSRKLLHIPDAIKVESKKEAPRNYSCSDGECVALTFDDGPGVHTPKLLDILKEHKVKATFYVLGSEVMKRPDIAKRIKNDGHQIGNHTWTHANLAKVSPEQVRDEISRTNNIIKEVVGVDAKTIRPPYGSVNEKTVAEFKNLGMSSVMWSVDTRDWADRNSQIVCSRAVSSAKSGSIILLHDIHLTSVDAVPCIIDGLKRQGYRLVTVDEILPVQNPGATYYSGD